MTALDQEPNVRNCLGSQALVCIAAKILNEVLAKRDGSVLKGRSNGVQSKIQY